MDHREKEYLELLNKKFDESAFIDFVRDLLNLNQFDISNNIEERKDVPKQYQENIDYYKYIAKYNDGINNIGILIVKLGNKTSTNARTAQRNFIATILSKYDLDASLVAFYSDKENNWRLSFVKKEIDFTDKGFIISLSPAKRFSYLVGENESVHTAKEYLLKLLKINDRKINIDDIEQVFDVEKVTKRFFEEYKEKYLQLKEYLDNNDEFLSESKKADFNSVEFAKKLMGQIVFLYFLQKKGWLGVQLVPNKINISEFNELLSNNDIVSQNVLNMFYELKDDYYVIERTKLRLSELEEDIVNLSNIFKNTKYDMAWGTGEKDFIRSMYKQAIKEHKNFFDDYLEPFFYKGLNEKRDNQYFALFNCKIPFLNGGLFEPINNYRWSSAHFSIPNTLFSNSEKDGILDFLDLYNFTIDEEEPLEKDIAVDPEMLGKIFENLLEVDDRKSKGAFYTPRDIVYYMCQESIASYLVTKTHVDYDEIMKFIKYGDLITQLDWENHINEKKEFYLGKTIFNNILNIDKALVKVKIADPAVGSGAFPLGMLTEIVKIRNNLSIYMLIQNDLNIINLDIIHNTEQGKRELFDMKLQTIENSIFAVDIEPSAVDITKLRLWLSLIVDYPNNDEPRPLPNLDCKIMQGNSLLDEFDGIPLFSEKILDNNLKKYKRKSSDLSFVADINIQQKLYFDNDDVIDLNIYIDEMLKLQKEYFTTSDTKLKKELKEKIDLIQFGMIEESLKNNPEKLQEFKEQAKKKNKPWFVWKLEFYDVFKNNGGFDIVIGNPPYLEARNEKFSNELKDKLQNKMEKKYGKNQKYISRGSDLLIYFYELAISLINKDGINMFITQNSWLDTDFGQKFQQYLLKYSCPCLIIDSDFKQFKENANINTIITLIKSKYCSIKNIDFIRMHESFDKLYFTLCNLENINYEGLLSLKRFSKNSKLVKEYKWGFLYNAPDFFLKLMDVLDVKGLSASQITETKVSIGQGLNIKKDCIYDNDVLSYNINSDAIIPIFTVKNNGLYCWENATSYIIDKSRLDKNFVETNKKYINFFDSSNTSKVPPALILPRGVGNRYFSAFNSCNGFSSSYVDIYVFDYKNHMDLVKRLWIFTNSTIFQLYREITGRNNLGGGMLKAEATDLQKIPILFEFDLDRTNNIFSNANKFKANSVEKNIDSILQIEIDDLVFDYLNVDSELRKRIVNYFIFLVNKRCDKSKS